MKKISSSLNKKNHRSAAYTLIEFIMVIAVVAIIGLTIVYVLYFGLNMWATIQAQAEARRQATSFLELITRQLQQGELPTWEYALADSAEISFNYDANGDGLEETLRYYLDTTSGEIRLTVDGGTVYSVITTGVASLGFSVSGESKLITIDLEMELPGGRTMIFRGTALPRSSWPAP